MGIKKLQEKFARTAQNQLDIAMRLCEGKLWTAKQRMRYDVLVGVLCTKHVTSNATIYVQDCGTMGFRAAKFYDCGLDFRIGSFQESQDRALNEALDIL